MKDDPETYIKFVKIVERFPEVYNETLEAYKNAKTQSKNWEKIAECVKEELNEHCTAHELKVKWRGIRMSSNWMFKRYNNIDNCGPSHYYLYDSIKFLEPFLTNPTPATPKSSSSSSKKRSSDNDTSVAPIHESLEFEELDLKPEVIDIAADDDDVENNTNNDDQQSILKEYLENNEFRANPLNPRHQATRRSSLCQRQEQVAKHHPAEAVATAAWKSRPSVTAFAALW
ncbi:alcohol dehydrogenase transcription factor myb/SANT-like domain-containing protein [Phthorimaea operculella]|nr:alcohol dehydrogenase transcription factor myb/SANT-like domain-containing protein [Phthorimaea operculella]